MDLTNFFSNKKTKTSGTPNPYESQSELYQKLVNQFGNGGVVTPESPGALGLAEQFPAQMRDYLMSSQTTTDYLRREMEKRRERQEEEMKRQMAQFPLTMDDVLNVKKKYVTAVDPFDTLGQTDMERLLEKQLEDINEMLGVAEQNINLAYGRDDVYQINTGLTMVDGHATVSLQDELILNLYLMRNGIIAVNVEEKLFSDNKAAITETEFMKWSKQCILRFTGVLLSQGLYNFITKTNELPDSL